MEERAEATRGAATATASLAGDTEMVMTEAQLAAATAAAGLTAMVAGMKAVVKATRAAESQVAVSVVAAQRAATVPPVVDTSEAGRARAKVAVAVASARVVVARVAAAAETAKAVTREEMTLLLGCSSGIQYTRVILIHTRLARPQNQRCSRRPDCHKTPCTSLATRRRRSNNRRLRWRG